MTPMDFWAQQRVLVLAPHADDETFGCGGLMAKVKAAGGEVYVIVASVGDLHHYGVDGQGGRQETLAQVGRETTAIEQSTWSSFHGPPTLELVTGAQRADEFAEAMRVLQVDGHEVLFTDPQMHMRLDALPLRDLIALLERGARYAIDNVAPTVLVLPACSYNQDHDALFKAGFAACRPHLAIHRPFIPLVLSCDGPQLSWHHSPVRPTFYVDITAYLDIKLRAHACHRSQLKPPPHHSSLENLERLARLRGTEISVGAAEAFQCHRVAL